MNNKSMTKPAPPQRGPVRRYSTVKLTDQQIAAWLALEEREPIGASNNE